MIWWMPIINKIKCNLPEKIKLQYETKEDSQAKASFTIIIHSQRDPRHVAFNSPSKSILGWPPYTITKKEIKIKTQNQFLNNCVCYLGMLICTRYSSRICIYITKNLNNGYFKHFCVWGCKTWMVNKIVW